MTEIRCSTQACDKMVAGANILADAVRVTLGPRGRNVIREKKFGPPVVVNSGVLVAKAIKLEDPFENMGAQFVREVAAKPASSRSNKGQGSRARSRWSKDCNSTEAISRHTS